MAAAVPPPREGANPGFDLVDVDPDAIRPVDKVQAAEEHRRALDACLFASTSGAEIPKVTKRTFPPPLDAFILDDIVSASECEALIKCAEGAGYSFWNAAVSTATFRNSDTVEIHSAAVADELWRRCAHSVVPTVVVEQGHPLWEPGLEGTWKACGVNEHLLFNKYEPGGHFSPHTDGATIVDMNRRSLYSMLVYLNRCPDGGGTALFSPPEGTSMGKFVVDPALGVYRWPEEWQTGVAPVESGTALVFRQDTSHEGVPVGPGNLKIIIRTDVMYERVPPVFIDDVGKQAYDLHREAQSAEGEGDHMTAMKLYRHCRRLCPEYADFVGMA